MYPSESIFESLPENSIVSFNKPVLNLKLFFTVLKLPIVLALSKYGF